MQEELDHRMNETNIAANTTQTLSELYTALAAAQGEFLPIEKNRSVTIKPRDSSPYSFRYADLDEITNKTRPALSKYKLALFQPLIVTGNDARLVCVLAHASGATAQSEITLPHPLSLKEPKQFGALVSYFRRYIVQAMLGIAADDDLDEDGQGIDDVQHQPQGSGQKPAVNQPQRRAAPAKANDEKPADSAAATTGELAYITKKINNKGMNIAQARELAGLDAGETLDGLTKDGFTALKDALA